MRSEPYERHLLTFELVYITDPFHDMEKSCKRAALIAKLFLD